MSAPATIELDQLDPCLRAWLERLATSGPVLLRQAGQTIGTLTYSATALEGTIIPAAAAAVAPAPGTGRAPHRGDLREGTKVLATTMRLSDPARDLLRQSFGPDWIVLDFHDAPDTADVVLTSAHSPQLTHRWTLLFPHARIIVTEILDPDLDLDVAGPVGRLLEAGAHAYLPPRRLAQVAEGVQMYLAGRSNGALGSSPPTTHQLTS